MPNPKIIVNVILIAAVIMTQSICIPSVSAESGRAEMHLKSEVAGVDKMKDAVETLAPQKNPASFWRATFEKVMSFFKGKPDWQKILERRLSAIRNDPGIRVLPDLAENPTCWVNPIRDDVLQNIGRHTLSGDRQQQEGWTYRFARYLHCINYRGMGIWDRFFADVHKDCLELDKREMNMCLRATTVPALMVSDYFLHTGYTKVQMAIRENLPSYQRAFRDQGQDSLFCINHNDGSMLRFGSGRGGPILQQAVTAMANNNAELGLGLCSICEMAHAGFQGICDRGLQEILQCLAGDGGVIPGGDRPSEGGPAAGAMIDADTPRGIGTGDVENADPYGFDSFNGMSEQALRAAACGLGGGMSGSLGRLRPSSSCTVNVIAAMRDSNHAGEAAPRLMDCHQRYYGTSIWYAPLGLERTG